MWVIDPIDGTFDFVRGGQNSGDLDWSVREPWRPSFGVIYAACFEILELWSASPARSNTVERSPAPGMTATLSG
ncbi:hypothetical protein [Rhizobium nepotum]|uniref:hypothetical protein n=1 Tax=Rhizobium nepotum TaxID=1035271 RepID=UPI003CF1F425